jgi:hypothetical protein
LTGPFPPLGHSKQIRHWSLMRMLYWPLRSPPQGLQRVARQGREVLGIRSKVRNPGIHRSSCTLHQCGQAPTPMRFEHEP